MEPRVTVTRWVKARIDELVDEEMGSGTQVEQDDYKAAVERFANRMNIVQKEMNLAVKGKQTQAAELFEAAKLQSAMVFGIGDKPIAGIESASGGVSGPSSTFFALNPARKRKRAYSSRPSNDAMLLSETFETVLAQALLKTRESSTTPATSVVPGTITTPVVGPGTSDHAFRDTKITDMEHRIEARMKARRGDMQSKLDQMLAAIGGKASRGGNNSN